MADCIDCLHFDICQFNEKEQAVINLKSSYRDISNDIADGCRFFKNKADFVEIVRCKDCIHYENEWCEILRAESPISDGFCCYGEKKEGADNG